MVYKPHFKRVSGHCARTLTQYINVLRVQIALPVPLYRLNKLLPQPKKFQVHKRIRQTACTIGIEVNSPLLSQHEHQLQRRLLRLHRRSVGRGCDLEFPSSPTPALSAHSPLLHWLYDPEGYLKRFRGLEPPSFLDATTLLPSGITPGFAFHEVREWNDDIGFTSPLPGRDFRGEGFFGSNTDGLIDPDVLSSLRRQFAIPIWDTKKSFTLIGSCSTSIGMKTLVDGSRWCIN